MRPIDLFHGAGLEGLGRHRYRAIVGLSLQVHHAACDGKAVLQVADDFLRSYARAVDRRGARQSNCRRAMPRPCEGRGTFGLTALKYLRMLPAQLMGLWACGCFSCKGRFPS